MVASVRAAWGRAAADGWGVARPVPPAPGAGRTHRRGVPRHRPRPAPPAAPAGSPPPPPAGPPATPTSSSGGSAGCRGRWRTATNPLYTTYLHAPLGVNGMWNTPVPVLATLFAPITLTAGPVVAYNVGDDARPGRVRTRAGARAGRVDRALVAARSRRPALRLLPVHDRAQLRRPSEPAVGGAATGAAVAAARLLVAPASPPWRTGVLIGRRVRRADRHLHPDRRAVRGPARRGRVGAGGAMARSTAARLAPDVLRAAAGCLATYAVLCAYPLYLLLAGPARPRSQIRDPETYELRRGEPARAHAPDGAAAATELRSPRSCTRTPASRAATSGRAARGRRRRGGDSAPAAHPHRRRRRGGGVGAVARGDASWCSATTRAWRCPGVRSRACR